tara:strand:+ start:7440 stop:8183 length:744 start_codon:yes stop_codon:yes gene_type:complete
MENSKIIFAVPTLFNRPQMVFEAVQKLYEQAELSGIDYVIYLVCNTEDENFMNWETGIEKVKKIVSNVQFNISVALNKVVDKMGDNDYFCFIHDDMFIHDDKWLSKFIEIFENDKLNCGALGVRPHSTGEKYCKPVNLDLPYKVSELLWSDGVIFTHKKIFNQCGKFDEIYFADREQQDFNYKLMENGYKNYMVHVDKTHLPLTFQDSKGVEEKELFDSHVVEAERIYNERWLEWETKKINEVGFQC